MIRQSAAGVTVMEREVQTVAPRSQASIRRSSTWSCQGRSDMGRLHVGQRRYAGQGTQVLNETTHHRFVIVGLFERAVPGAAKGPGQGSGMNAKASNRARRSP